MQTPAEAVPFIVILAVLLWAAIFRLKPEESVDDHVDTL